ncbi:LPO_1073/Vpar_1526 family protein [Acetobacterium wieringae]|uniref:LPO_1073/Vpar_1526 family protein n=1 Tax=Acetobacterium wieringae TaxID=52694 RepID=UPI0026F16FD1|nr:LPO_1073/Vpar_1526 family protein [Acetobacterium wieringae]
MDEKLYQKNGRESNNIQVGTINSFGLSYTETKELCRDLISDELSIYKNEAEIEAHRRNEKFLDDFILRLKDEKLTNEIVLEEFKNPDTQHCFVNAQKAFIRTGTPEMEEILTRLMVDRIKENKRTLLQIALNEAITVVPLLLPEQFDILALVFLLRYTINNTIVSKETFKNYCKNYLLPQIIGLNKKESLYQHIEYAKCGSITLAENRLSDIFSRRYRGLFLHGYTKHEIEDLSSKYPQLFTSCLNDVELIQFNTINEDSLVNALKEYKMNEEEINRTVTLFNSNVMDNEKITSTVCDLVPDMKQLFEDWDNSSMKNLTLTSVGIVIGATHLKERSEEKFDLNIWV